MKNRVFIKNLKNFIDSEVVIAGWIHVRRDQGKMIFFDFRDATGKIQGVVLPNQTDALNIAKKLRPEWVVEVNGKVNKRPERMVNENEENGDIELEVLSISIINKSETTPFEINQDSISVGEDTRLQYRYLDLRTIRMANNLRKRGEMIKFFRDFLIDEKSFLEIETPILTKTTPEGARDFLVPSRLHKGNFYALPQSPQQYKQLLMVAGFERYFQVARCFRDEDPRADRAYGEFTQLDMEMSFIDQEDILELIEIMFTKMIEKIFPEKHISQKPWPRISHKDAMKKYGTDKPDLRKNKDDKNELAFSWTINFPLFTEQNKDDFFFGSGNAKYAPSHHMFTAPHQDDIALLDSEPEKVRGLQHDLVLNGFEVGGGSIRIHDPIIQNKIFDLIGFSKKQKDEFKHTLKAFTYGVPPHGGIASGIDRLLMVILGEPSVREVIAFPNTKTGQTAVMEAPSEATDEQLKEAGIDIKKTK